MFVVGMIVNLDEIHEGRICDTLEDATDWRNYLMNVEMCREKDIVMAEINDVD